MRLPVPHSRVRHRRVVGYFYVSCPSGTPVIACAVLSELRVHGLATTACPSEDPGTAGKLALSSKSTLVPPAARNGQTCGPGKGVWRVTQEARRDLYDALRALEGLASRAQSGYSRRATARAVKHQFGVELGRRISEWLPNDPATAKVPQDTEAVWALVSVWSAVAGEKPQSRRYWSNLVESAQVGGGIRASRKPSRKCLVFGSPPRPADAYQDRPELRARIESALDSRKMGAVCQVLSGDAGVGKSQLAASIFRAEVYADAAGPGVDVGLWVNASSRDGVVSAYARALAGVQPTRISVGDAEDRAADFLSFLATTEQPWLIVLDDVDDLAALDSLWPQGRGGRVLLTTRRGDSAAARRGELVKVGLFTPPQSLAYLRTKLESLGARAGVELQGANLASDLGHLPLALAQAAAVIIDDAISCETYRAMLTDRARTLRDVFPDDPRASGDDYTQALPATWSLASERANALVPAGVSGRMLLLAAVLDPSGIPEEVLLATAARSHLLEEAPLADHYGGDAAETIATGTPMLSWNEARRAIRNAARFSLITHDATAGDGEIQMHALAQRATLEYADDQAIATTVRVAADALAEVWAGVSEPGKMQVLRANATVLAARHGEMLWENGAHQVLFIVGRSLGEAGQSKLAWRYFTDLVSSAVRMLGAEHVDTLNARNDRASWRGQAGDAVGAAVEFEELLVDRMRVLSPDHPDTLRTRGQAARWQGHAGDIDGSSAALQRVLPDLERVLGPYHRDTLNAKRSLARWRGDAGDAVGAAADFEELLPDMVRVLGPQHRDTLNTLHSLAWWRGKAGDSAGAAAALDDLFAEQVQILGRDHPATLAAGRDLARWRGDSGDMAGAAAMLESILPDLVRVLGFEHHDTLNARHSLAWWQGKAGDPARAVRALQDLLTDRRRFMPADHPDTLTTRRDLARWRGDAGDAVGAAADFEELLPDMVRVLGPDHPETKTAFRYAQRQTKSEP
jgi:hypothetical protein